MQVLIVYALRTGLPGTSARTLSWKRLIDEAVKHKRLGVISFRLGTNFSSILNSVDRDHKCVYS